MYGIQMGGVVFVAPVAVADIIAVKGIVSKDCALEAAIPHIHIMSHNTEMYRRTLQEMRQGVYLVSLSSC